MRNLKMKTYLFLKSRDDLYSDRIFVIDESRIDRDVNLADCYDSYGQEIGHYYANDNCLGNYNSDAMKDLKKAISEKFKLDVDDFEIVENEDEFVVDERYADVEIDKDEINQFIASWRDENEWFTKADVINYWDGQNWRSKIIACDIEDAIEFDVIDDEKEIERLYEAIEFKSYEERVGGIIYYSYDDEGKSYEITESCWQGAWENYQIVEYHEL